MRYLSMLCGLFILHTVNAHSMYSVCFTPQQQCTTRIVNLIHTAKHSIFMQAYMFTSSAIADALLKAKHQGVKVELLVDKSQFQCQHFSAVRGLLNKGIPVWADVQPVIAHNKVIIVDKKIVETGSFNYTYSAQHKNTENVLIIYNAAIAHLYWQNWLLRKNQSLAVASSGCQDEGDHTYLHEH